MKKTTTWQHVKALVLVGLVFSILLFSLFSSLHLWLHQQVRLHHVQPRTSINLNASSWHGEQREITLDKKRFDIHHIQIETTKVILFGEWDTSEDDLLKEEKQENQKAPGFSYLSFFLFYSPFPEPHTFFHMNPIQPMNNKTHCRWLEQDYPPTSPPPDQV